jgi:3-oxoacyl-[acyl-carrier protein] reductase
VSGRRCIVTGAARGIGQAIATTLAAEGASVGLLDVQPEVKAAAAALPSSGSASVAVAVADLADPAATQAALGDLVAELGGVDVLVNNAGIFGLRPLLELSVEEWDRTQAVNVRSMLVTTQVVARSMIAAGHGGTIVNLASMAAKRPALDQAHYAASKAAVVALTQATALELGPHGITANAICPGYVLTEMGADTRTPEQVAAWSSQSPLGRCADVDDVARVALFLASADAAYLTGQALNVTGGMIMH